MLGVCLVAGATTATTTTTTILGVEVRSFRHYQGVLLLAVAVVIVVAMELLVAAAVLLETRALLGAPSLILRWTTEQWVGSYRVLMAPRPRI